MIPQTFQLGALLRLPLLIAECIDNWLWKHSRARRRYEIRKRLEIRVTAYAPVCDWCKSKTDVLNHRNGRICRACRSGYDFEPTERRDSIGE